MKKCVSCNRYTAKTILEKAVEKVEDPQLKTELKKVLCYFTDNAEIFEVSKSKMLKFSKWRRRLNKKLGEAYVGAAGGGYTFSFIPTGLGTITQVKRVTGEVLDLTEDDDLG